MDNDFKTRVECFRMEAYYEQGFTDIAKGMDGMITADGRVFVSAAHFFVFALLDLIAEEAAIAECKREGHDWEDQGHGGRDSGCVSMVCKRCGWAKPTRWMY
jgi:hypothetical protein